MKTYQSVFGSRAKMCEKIITIINQDRLPTHSVHSTTPLGRRGRRFGNSFVGVDMCGQASIHSPPRRGSRMGVQGG